MQNISPLDQAIANLTLTLPPHAPHRVWQQSHDKTCTIWLAITVDSAKNCEIRYRIQGPLTSLAAISYLHTNFNGRNCSELTTITNATILEYLQIPPQLNHQLDLITNAWNKCIANLK